MLIRVFEGHTNCTLCLCFVTVVVAFMLIRVFEGHTRVYSVQFSPHDPDEILTGSGEETVRLWRKSDGHLVRVFEGHTIYVWSVQFSPHDPDEILTGSGDNTVRTRTRS
eukprot:TRINITY_DN11763_c0_g1_i1.p2 TRINITY_DN11763_c0_g1~~TRINITY_DN11763_c0_g1_i1.p2  ORF type:complete len:119 (+),score=20.10 TRINITY_DN11763_c0_g1_i1:32-358(+)